MSLVIREMQIKPANRYYLTPVRMAIIKKSTINAGECVEKRKPSSSVGGNVNWYSHCREQYGDSFKKKNTRHKIPYGQTIPQLSIHPEETTIEKDTHTPIFIAALVTTARMWEQPRSSSKDEWVKKLWYIYTMEYYSAIRRNESESDLGRWMNPEPVKQRVMQKEKNKYRILMHINGI